MDPEPALRDTRPPGRAHGKTRRMDRGMRCRGCHLRRPGRAPAERGRCLLREHPRDPAAVPGAIRAAARHHVPARSEEHTSELQSLMRISYAVLCLKKKQNFLNH